MRPPRVSSKTCTTNCRVVTKTLIDRHTVVYTEDGPSSRKMTYALQRKLCLTGGKTYTFCFRYMLRRVNCRPLELVPALFDSTNTTNLKSTWQTGFLRSLREVDGWAAFGSTTAPGTIYLTAAGSQGP